MEPHLDTPPRWRSTLAGLTDLAVASAVGWGLRSRGGGAAKAARLLGPSSTLLREQMGTPGQRLLGIRAVDERTGKRTAAWRSLAALGLGVGGQLLAKRLAPPQPTPEQKLEHQRFHEQMGETYRRHSGDPTAGEAERARLLAHQPAGLSVDLRRVLVPQMAVGLIGLLLRRRLISTAEIRRPG